MSQVVLAGFDIDPPTFSPSTSSGTLIGNMAPGLYDYIITYVTKYGETTAGPASIPLSTVASSINISNIPVSDHTEVMHKKIYRREGINTYKFVAEISNKATTYIDTASEGSLGPAPPTDNTASSLQICRGWVSFSKPIAKSFENIVATGTTLSTAAKIFTETVYCSVPSDLNGVALPSISDYQVGSTITINNLSPSNQLSIYPSSSTSNFTGYSSGDPYILALAKSISFFSISTTEWNVISTTISSSDITDTIPVSKGGSGNTSFTSDSWLKGNGTGPIIAVKNNLSAIVAPTVADDATVGYSVGSRWINTLANEEHVCVDNTNSAAVWVETTAGASGGEANTASSAGGLSLVLPKNGDDLPFKGLSATTNKITLTSNPTTLGIDVAEGNIPINNLMNAPVGTVVGTTDTQILTNKNMTSTTNNIAAKSLHSATTVINISSATAPSVGQVLTATSAVAAAWQNPSTGAIINSKYTATDDASTTSSSYVALDGLAATPAAGTYFVSFSSSGSGTVVGADMSYALFKNGNVIDHTMRNMDFNGGALARYDITLHTQDIVTVNGSEAIDVRFYTSEGTITIHERSLIFLKVG